MEIWFSSGLLKWYKKNKRELPWRNETDAYKIWLSEIILQQTQVIQGTSYYLKFTKNYPKIGQLANATEDEVLKMWQGLGYYSRARNLHATAKFIQKEHKGVFPANYNDIKALRGIGDYTAAAISSFAFNLPHAVVDGNVYRVLSRLFGIETPIDSGQGKKEFQLLATDLMDKKDPGQYNQAIMEFGSQYCKPNKPNCEACIFSSKCFAFKAEKVNEFPVKVKKIKIKNRYLNYVVLADKKQNILVNRRSENDIWKGLYEFFLVESDEEIAIQTLLNNSKLKKTIGPKPHLLFSSKTYKHILSHQRLYAKFFVIKTNSVFSKSEKTIPLNKLTELAFSRLIEKFLNDCKLKEIV